MGAGCLIVINPERTVTVEDTLDGEPRLGQLQKAVDGYIEIPGGFDTIELTVMLLTYMDEESVRRLMPLKLNAEGRRRCIAYCNEEGKTEGRPFNLIATQLWAQALLHTGNLKRREDGTVEMPDVLVGPVAILVGEIAIAQEEAA